MTLRDEFRLKKFCFAGVSTERFFMSQWRLPGLAYLLYRIITAAYTLTILVMTAHNQISHHNGALQHWGAYLTNWTYMVLTLYHVLHAVLAVLAFTVCSTELRPCVQRPDMDEHLGQFDEFQSGRDDLGYEDSEVTRLSSDVTYFQPPSRWHLNIIWILLNVSSTASFMVTLVFWAILVPTMEGSLSELSHDNLQLHLINTILVLIEHSVTAVPIRVMHMLYPFIYALIYLLFSLFYWIPDHSHVMYNILDWGKPGETMGYVLLVGFVVIPLLHFVLYLFYRLKLKIFASIYSL